MLGIGAAGSERPREAVFCGGDDLKLSDANKKYEIPPNATMMIAVPVISLALRPKPLLLKSILASGLAQRCCSRVEDAEISSGWSSSHGR